MNTEHVTRVINAAGLLLSDKSKRTRDQYARNAAGEKTDVMDPAACQFCLVGALEKVNGDKEQHMGDIRMVLGPYLTGQQDYYMTAPIWDLSTDAEQDEIVAKLLAYPGAPVNAP